METVVHVTTLKQWKSVLDVWFSQGFAWSYGPNVYNNRYFDDGERFLRLSGTKILRGKIFITAQPIEYADFMAKQEKKMTRTVVHVTTLGQWRSVLDVWFKQEHKWLSGNKAYHEGYFQKGDRYLLLNDDMKILIPTPNQSSYIEYQDFIEQ